jgi:allophanate hydrolase
MAAAAAAAASHLRLAVCGLHLRGQPLNWQLTDLNATFVRACRSAAAYKVYAFTDAAGKTKPGMVRVAEGEHGGDFFLELWDVPLESFGRFILQVPAPLGIGTVELDDGAQEKGFICEAWVAEAAKRGSPRVADITALGSWLAYIEQRAQAQQP